MRLQEGRREGTGRMRLASLPLHELLPWEQSLSVLAQSKPKGTGLVGSGQTRATLRHVNHILLICNRGK